MTQVILEGDLVAHQDGVLIYRCRGGAQCNFEGQAKTHYAAFCQHCSCPLFVEGDNVSRTLQTAVNYRPRWQCSCPPKG